MNGSIDPRAECALRKLIIRAVIRGATIECGATHSNGIGGGAGILDLVVVHPDHGRKYGSVSNCE